MSDFTLPEPTLPEPPKADRWIVGTALASLLLHAGVLAVLLWQPLPESLEAEQPPAIDVELVPPPEETSASEPPPAEEPAEEEAAAEEPAAELEPPAEAPEPQPQEEVSEEAQEQAAAEPPGGSEPPAEATSAEPQQEQAAAPASSAATAAPETPAEAEAAETVSGATETAATPAASETAASEAPESPQAAETTVKVAPIPLARPRVRGLTAPSEAPDEVASAPTPDPGQMVEGTVVAAAPAEPDVATLELGALRSAERFYLEAMLSTPRLAPAREMLKTLPPEKRLEQTCNIEALAQIGYSGEGFAPDVVMAEAYALSEATGTRLVANGAIFRSGEKWYGIAFDCTLSDDLTEVTAFTYRLGADVTEAVLARLNKN